MSDKPELKTPVDVANSLDPSLFTDDQSATIVCEVYQPLMQYIQYLEKRIEALEENNKT